ncbi:MAG: hypothetical protein ACJ77K_06975 [Bacteroidia bacterium]
MKKLPLLFFALLLIASCGGGSENKQVAAVKDSLAFNSVPDSAADEQGSGDEEVMEPKEIPFDLFGKRRIDLDTPLVADSILTALFPGNYYPSEETMVVWKSKQTKCREFTGWFDEEKEHFPCPDSMGGSMETRIGTEIRYSDDDGNKNILISLSSFDFTGDVIRCGRFACAHLALAHFRLEKDKWVLKAWTPAIGCFGAFGSMPVLNLVKFGKNNYGVYLDNSNGGPGGAYYGDSYVYGLINGEFRLLLKRNSTSLGNAMSMWHSEFSGTGDDKIFGDLRCTTKGSYQTYAHFKAQDDDTSNVPAAIKDLIKTKEHFNFTIVTDFIFENGKYVFKDEDAVASDMTKEEWAKEP